MEVGEVYRDDPAFDVAASGGGTGEAENVPLLPVLRYKPSGLRKRQEWEKTWELQREEDAIERHCVSWSVVRSQRPERRPGTNDKLTKVGDIPVPPKYTSADFISTAVHGTGLCVASWTCPRNAGSASRIAKARTGRW